jgi:predicted nucleic acid-binding protein
MTYVVDASVAVKWLVPERLSAAAERILAMEVELLAPDLLPIEAANALWKKTVRRELSARDADRALALLLRGPILLQPSGPLLPRALSLARRFRHPVYDCVYLALAERERASLVTADARLRQAAERRVRVVDLASV